ncbi:hypothetical protein RRG08_065855 [Elysia crispata]|uniref:Fibrinogen C-terminal domain-containing protein n=1 Tax=Elysia crispata TaxID=231223 RepID=A0AAE1A8K1_9GAST|nr:hypothetical protein RRG08_065855 [Elysia crispata]
MEKSTCLLAILSLFVGCQGLELTLSRDESVSLGRRTGCAVLMCEEIFQVDQDGNSTSAYDDKDQQIDIRLSQWSVLEMSIFKHDITPSDSRNQDGRTRLIASLTRSQPSVTRVADGVRVDGTLTARRATLRLGLHKQEDCGAEYTCRVVSVGADGGEHVSASRLLQPRCDDCRLQAYQGGWAPAVTLNLLSLVHDMDNKLTQVLSASQDSCQRRIQALENHLEDKITLSENRVGDKIAASENRLENKLHYVENRLEDKMGSLEKSLESKMDTFQNLLDDKISEKIDQVISELNMKIESDKSQFESFVENTVNKILPSLKKDNKTTDDAMQAKFDSLNEKLDSYLNNTTVLVTSTVKDLNLIQTIDEHEQIYLKSLKEAVFNISDTSADTIHLVEGHCASINQNTQAKFEQLDSNINRSTSATRFVLHDLLSQTQSNMSANLQSAITDTLSLKSCRKGQISVLPELTFPYPLIRPNNQSAFDFPYLCDTFTDGGGWIIIQRRTSGNVDFYRTWSDYKNGFGSLAEDFWLGNDKIHDITTLGLYELKVGIIYNGQFKFAHYTSFSISDESSNYVLDLGAYDGTAGDSLSHHKGRQFTTRDRDNDGTGGNCARDYRGAWWYVACHASNLNGQWGARDFRGPAWRETSMGEPVTFTEMKIRLVNND